MTEALRKNRTIDWQRKESARAGMRKMVKRLLKKYKYPPEEAEHALDIVLKQCEEWSDVEDYDVVEAKVAQLYPQREVKLGLAAEDKASYNAEKSMQD